MGGCVRPKALDSQSLGRTKKSQQILKHDKAKIVLNFFAYFLYIRFDEVEQFIDLFNPKILT